MKQKVTFNLLLLECVLLCQYFFEILRNGHLLSIVFTNKIQFLIGEGADRQGRTYFAA